MGKDCRGRQFSPGMLRSHSPANLFVAFNFPNGHVACVVRRWLRPLENRKPLLRSNTWRAGGAG